MPREISNIVLQADHPTDPVVSAADWLLQSVTVKDYPIRLRPPTEAAVRAGKGYIAISYYEFGRRKTTSGGSSLTEALSAVQAIIERLDSGSVKAPLLFEDLIAEYLDPGRAARKPWSAKHRYNQERLAKLFVTPRVGRVACADISRAHVQASVNSAPTEGEGARVKILLGAIIKFGVQRDYLSQPLDKLIGGVYWQEGNRPRKEAKPVLQGASPLYVDPSNIPRLDDVYELAKRLAAADRAPWWWEMLPIFMAFTGLRIGEAVALDNSSVELAPTRKIFVMRQFSEISGEFTPPKREKARYTRYPDVTPSGRHFKDGYPLAEMVAKRKAEIADGIEDSSLDQSPGMDHQGLLLFPSPHGKPWRQSNLSRRLLRPAAVAAGWPKEDSGRLRWSWHSLRHFFATHSLIDRRLPPSVVSDALGHASVSITMDVYLSRGQDSWELL